METTLAKLCPGETGTVLAVEDGPLSGRLRDLGFTVNSRITLAGTAPLGDPLAFRVRGALIALRKKDAALVTVRVCGRAEEGGSL